MNKKFINAWHKHKEELENYFRKTKQHKYNNYKKLVKLIIELVINKEAPTSYDTYNTKRIHIINDSEYSGSLLFIIPINRYTPKAYEYIITTINYGSCSACDTLLAIQELNYDYNEDDEYVMNNVLPNEQQIKDYMQLCLHLIQHMKKIYTEKDYDIY